MNRSLIHMCNYDVAVIKDTWLRERRVWQLKFPGYSCVRRNGSEGKFGEGVTSSMKEHVTTEIRCDITDDSSSEDIW